MNGVKMTQQQANYWLKGMTALNKLNENFDAVKKLARGTAAALNWWNQNTGAPPQWVDNNFNLMQQTQRRGASLEQKLEALNYAYMLIKLQKAYVMPSQQYPGDFDIVTDRNPESAEIVDAIFRRNSGQNLDGLGLAFLAPFVPLLIKAGAVVITGALVYGCVDAVSDTYRETESMKRDITMQQQAIAADMAKQNPAAFEKWTKFLGVNLPKGSWWDQLKKSIAESTGSMLPMLLILFAGFIAFKHFDKEQN